MKTIKTLLLSASVLAIGLSTGGINNQAQAAQGSSKYVKNVDIDFPGFAAVVNVKNVSANKLLSSLDLNVQENKLDFEVGGLIECKGNNLNVVATQASFGPVSISGTGLNANSTLHQASIALSEDLDDNGIVEYTAPSIFSVPLNKINNGHPALRVDPLAELEKARQAFNGSDLEFYQQDREIVLQRPLSVSGACRKKNNPNKVSSGYETKNHVIQIKYKGDPNLTEKPVVKLSAQLANNPNQIQQNPDLPFQLNKAEFMPNLPHYTGKCLPAQNPKIRINFQESGGKKGLMDLRVKAVSNQYADYGYYFETQGIINDPKNNSHLDFSFPLKEMLSQDKYSWMVTLSNKTYNHNMRVEVRHKNLEGGNWGQWKQYDTAVFKHRCVPQLNDKLIGRDNGSVGGYSNGQVPITAKPILGTKPKLVPINKFKVQPVPAPKPKRAPVN
ncbi:MAG: hypothetical protein V7776_11975 [Halopseudomonas aestusnigri]